MYITFGVVAILACATLYTSCDSKQDSVSVRRGIISFAPNITETICALEHGEQLIAVSSFCDYPPVVKSLPNVGGYFDPDLEKVTLLAPEMIMLQGKHHEVDDLARRNGIRAVHVNMDSFDTIYQGVTIIGETLGCTEKADALNAAIKSDLEDIRKSVGDLDRPKVLIITTRQQHDLNSLYTVGRKSFVSEVIETAGGDNIYHDENQAYIEASKETIVVKAPDVIIEFHAGDKLTMEEERRYIDDWSQMPMLPAVKNGRVYLVLESHALRPGPRIAGITRIIAGLLHPEMDGFSQ